MRILEQEIALRDETRAVDQAQSVASRQDHQRKTRKLAERQSELGSRVMQTIQTIEDLPNAGQNFEGDVALLTRVEQVMAEAYLMLSHGQAGPPTIAAETDVIELLLQSRRVNPASGGGGGSSPGGGGTGDTDRSALALLGKGAGRESNEAPRSVNQATGRGDYELPAEYRAGLDAFFEALERRDTGGIR